MSIKERDAVMDTESIPVAISVILTATLSGSVSAGLVGAIISLLAWREVRWDLVLAFGAIPPMLCAIGMSGIIIRGALSWIVVRHEPSPVQFIESDTERMHIVKENKRLLIDAKPMPVDSRDLTMFIVQSMDPSVMDWTQHRWEGTLMESGRKCDTRYHAAMMNVLTKTGVIEGYGRGTSGHMAVPTISDALSRVGLHTG